MGESDPCYDKDKNPVEFMGGALTSRQREVLQLVAEGKAVKELYKVLWESGADRAVLTAQLDKRLASLLVSRGNFDDEIYRVR